MARGLSCGCSNAMVVILNTAILVASAAVLFMWATSPSKNSGCDKLLQTPFLLVGAVLFVISLFGIVGAGCRISTFLWLYMAATFLVILGVSCFTAYLFVAVHKGTGGRENPLGAYSGWMQRTVNGGNWESIRNCLRDSKVCAEPLESPAVQSDFYKKVIAPVKMGCCQKPRGCTLNNQHEDCSRWGDESQVLCLACDSCKAAVLSNFRMDWKNVALMFLTLLSFLALVYFFGCCALGNIRQDKYSRYRHQLSNGGFTNAASRH